MKTLLLGALCLVICSSDTPSIPTYPTTDAIWLDRLIGTWQGDLGGATYTEEWRKVDDHTYDGIATMKKGDKVMSTENARITLFADHWLYLADPGGQGVSCFPRKSADATTWIFENTEHDFPKRIGYSITGDELTAWIAAASDRENRMEFPLKRLP